jgi:hypothetical protein
MLDNKNINNSCCDDSDDDNNDSSSNNSGHNNNRSSNSSDDIYYLGVIIFGSVRFLTIKNNQTGFFLKKNRNRVKLTGFGPVRFGS